MSENVYFSDDQLHAHYTRDETPDVGSFFIHTHDRFEVLLILSGKGQFTVEGTPYDIAPGDVFITRGGEAHCMNISPAEPYERLSIHFAPELVKAVDSEGRLLAPFLSRSLGEENRLTKADFREEYYLACLKNAFTAPDESACRTWLLSGLFAFLCLLSRAWKEKSPASPRAAVEPRLAEIIAYINANLGSELSLSTIASTFFLSPAYLNKRFTQATGTSVWNYILIKRLHAARDRIRNGRRVSEAAQTCGFHDYSAFYRAYVKRFGVNPAADSPEKGKKN